MDSLYVNKGCSHIIISRMVVSQIQKPYRNPAKAGKQVGRRTAIDQRAPFSVVGLLSFILRAEPASCSLSCIFTKRD